MNGRFGVVRAALPWRWLSAALPTLGFFALVEIGLRVAGCDLTVRPLEIRRTIGNDGDDFRTNLGSELFEADAETFWRPRPSKGPFNEQGYRGPSAGKEKRSGEFRILAVGDSNTLGHSATWVDELARIDPARFDARSLSVVNLGVYGYSSYQGKLRLRRFLSLHPDVVLVSFGGNDAALNGVEDEDYVTGFSAWWLGKLYLVDGLQRLAIRLQAASTPPRALPQTARVSQDQYAANLQEMVALARGAGALPVLLTRPFADVSFTVGSRSATKPYFDATFAVGRRLNVAVLDVDAIANHQGSLYDDHAHFNVRGHAVVGERIGRALVEIFRTGAYDLEPLRYRPEDPFEQLTNDFGAVAMSSTYGTLEQCLALLVARMDDAAPESVAEIDLSDPSETKFLVPPGVRPSLHDGAVCFRLDKNDYATIEFSPPGSGPRIVWLETGLAAGAAVIRLAWSDGNEFEDRDSVAMVVRPDGARSLARLISPQVETVRATYSVLGEPAEPCVRRFAVVPISQAKAGSSRKRHRVGHEPGPR